MCQFCMGDVLNKISDDVLQMMETMEIVFVVLSFHCFTQMKIIESEVRQLSWQTF